MFALMLAPKQRVRIHPVDRLPSTIDPYNKPKFRNEIAEYFSMDDDMQCVFNEISTGNIFI